MIDKRKERNMCIYIYIYIYNWNKKNKWNNKNKYKEKNNTECSAYKIYDNIKERYKRKNPASAIRAARRGHVEDKLI